MQQSQQPADNAMLNEQIQDCIQDCLNCNTATSDAAKNMSQQNGQNASLLAILQDAAEISLAAAHSMQRNSVLSGYICQACAEVCTHCAEVCFQAGMNEVGNACQNCASSCQQMVKMIP